MYIGGLTSDCDKEQIKDVFSEFGRVGLFTALCTTLYMSQVLKVWIAQKPPGFGFILMSCPGDAEDAVRSLHGTKMWGKRLGRILTNIERMIIACSCFAESLWKWVWRVKGARIKLLGKTVREKGLEQEETVEKAPVLNHSHPLEDGQVERKEDRHRRHQKVKTEKGVLVERGLHTLIGREKLPSLKKISSHRNVD